MLQCRHGKSAGLRGGRCASRDTPDGGIRRRALILRFLQNLEGSQNGSTVGYGWPIERLMAQMADRATRFRGIEMMMPDATQRRGDE